MRRYETSPKNFVSVPREGTGHMWSVWRSKSNLEASWRDWHLAGIYSFKELNTCYLAFAVPGIMHSSVNKIRVIPAFTELTSKQSKSFWHHRTYVVSFGQEVVITSPNALPSDMEQLLQITDRQWQAQAESQGQSQERKAGRPHTAHPCIWAVQPFSRMFTSSSRWW